MIWRYIVENIIDIILLISALITIASYFTGLIKGARDFILHKSEIELYAVVFFLCLGFGVLYSNLRLITFIISNSFNLLIDEYGFIIKIFATLFSFSVMLRITIRFRQLTGDKVKNQGFIRLFYVLSTIIFSTINVLNFYPYFYIELGYYVYLVDPFLLFLIYLTFFPSFIYIISSWRKNIANIDNKKLKQQLNYLNLPAGFLLIGRLLDFGVIPPLQTTTFTFIINEMFVSIALIIQTIIYFTYTDAMERFSFYFNVKSIFLIENRGKLLFEYEFSKKQESHLPISSRDIILGGITHAINQGLNKYLGIQRMVNTLKIGAYNLLFYYGKNIMGILLATEFSGKTIKNLKKLVEKFEITYEDAMVNWNGDTNFYDPEEVNDWVISIFRG